MLLLYLVLCPMLISCYVAQSMNDYSDIADAILPDLLEHRVLLLSGELGSGKTSFVQALGKKLGVLGIIDSPTFPIVQEYVIQGGDTFYHFDLYRLETIEDLVEIGFEDYLRDDSIVAIEWPQLAIPFLESYIAVSIALQEEERHMKITVMP